MSSQAHTYKAGGTSATAKNHFVKTGTTEQSCLINDTAGGLVIGITEENLVSGAGAAVVDVDGDITFLEMAEACDEGAEIKSNAAGEGIKVESNATPENQWVGFKTLEASSGDGALVRGQKVGYWKYA
jgi:hypothetical protein